MTIRRTTLMVAAALLASVASASAQSAPEANPAGTAPLTDRCESAPIMAAFALFGDTGRMPRELGVFLADAGRQRIEPYKAFDNVYYVGICWVSAWLITSPRGHVLIDTLYGSYTDQLLSHIRTVGFDPKDIKLVVVTHGHFDHAGGIAKLKAELAPDTRFAMTREGWREAAESATKSIGTPRPWKMIDQDLVLTDGQTVTYGDAAIHAYETPGHTMGTASFAFDARDGAKTYRAFTVGGLGLNAIRGPEQVEAFIASVKRIRDMTTVGSQPLDLHLTTHAFSTGLTEARELLKTRKLGDPHPLVDMAAFRSQLETLQAGAERRLVIERQKKR